MKKFLSLVLALVMTMSLVTIGAGATFTDDSAINYDEAVDVISAAGIVGGYADGSFNPKGSLTRGAAAKIICNIMLTPKVAGALPTNVAPYSDVAAGSTYAGYIAYLKNEGVISGYADGSFKPGAPLTGYAFLKMLLGAMGYDQNLEGYVGESWQINVAKQAKTLKLYDDNKTFNGNATATREEACLYALNILKQVPVKYERNQTVTIGDVVISNSSSAGPDGTEKLYEKFDLILEDFENDGETDNLGRPARTWTDDDGEEIGTYAETADKVYTSSVSLKAAYKDLKLTNNDNDTFDLYEVDGTATTVTLDKTDADTDVTNSDDNGVITEFFKDYNLAIQYAQVLGEVTNVNDADEDTDTKRSVDISCAALSDDVNVETEDFEEDDIVVMNARVISGDLCVENVEKAEKKTGKITKKVGDDTAYISGTKYELSDYADGTIPAVKTEVEFYVDACGFIIGIDSASDAVSTSNIAFVQKAAEVHTGDYDDETIYKATLRYVDGTKEIVVLKQDADIVYATQIVSYSVKDGKVDLKDSDDFYNYDGLSGEALFTKGQPDLTIGTTALVADSATKFVYISDMGTSDEAVKLYTGYKNAPDFGAVTYASAYAKDGKAIVVYMVGETAASAADIDAYVFYKGGADVVYDEDLGDDVSYIEALMVIDGKASVKKISEDAYAALEGRDETVVALTNYTVDKNGIIDFDSGDFAADAAAGQVTGSTNVAYKKGDGVVSVSGTSYAYTDKTVVYKVSDKLDEVTATSTIEKVADNKDGKNFSEIFVGVAEKNAKQLTVVFMIEK